MSNCDYIICQNMISYFIKSNNTCIILYKYSILTLTRYRVNVNIEVICYVKLLYCY